ncbi:Spy/CpxP family protein refolding chaperone [Parvibaculum sp.]|uniref:Spy/CpxP family protein refolding chaperone n=1 Tax=Parvibaculum sp. TaxID=2024848 RepID=UPI000C935411|nr:Spy/CpxP family protein refolding chaperone [Parvibaculum sp.]MAB12938.1 hypothetical protein [Parvibaculum sp.]
MNIRKAALAGIVTALLASTAYAHDPSGQNGGWMGGGYGMGPGMMGAGQDQMMGYGRGYGPGAMMGGGYGYGMMGAGCGMGGYDASGDYDTYVDGRLAFLKAELKITDDQSAAWSAYADALKENFQSMAGMHQQMFSLFQQGKDDRSVVDMLDLQISLMKTRVGALEKMKPAAEKLYAALSDDQQEKANQILPVMGCM